MYQREPHTVTWLFKVFQLETLFKFVNLNESSSNFSDVTQRTVSHND